MIVYEVRFECLLARPPAHRSEVFRNRSALVREGLAII